MKQAIRFIIVIAVLFLIFFLLKRSNGSGEYYHRQLAGDSLVAAINIQRSMFSSKGFPIGFQYQLLNEYAVTQNCKINITTAIYENDYWKMLVNKELDIVVMETCDSIPSLYSDMIKFSKPINDYQWAVRGDDKRLLDNINSWLCYYMQKKEYNTLKNKFFRSYKIDSHIKNMTQTNVLSPYDDIIKRQSKQIGWDWRLLAAIINQESNFSMSAHSRRGATGLMQIIPSTAKHYGVNDIYNPEENVRAGVLHIKHLQKIYKEEGMDSVNIVKFTLAAYNAGEGRIDDCMNFSIEKGKDYKNWEEVSRVIPLMKHPDHYLNADYLKFGKFNGAETIRYVDNVLSKYEEYQFVVKP